MLRDRLLQGRAVLVAGLVSAEPSCFAPGQIAAGLSYNCPGSGCSRAVLFCSGTGLRSQKKILRNPVPAPPDGQKPQMLLPPLKEIPPEPRPCAHRRAKTADAAALRSNSSGALFLRHRTARMIPPFAAKGIFVRDYRAHSTKTVMRTSFCTAKGKFRPLFAFRGKRHPPPAAV